MKIAILMGSATPQRRLLAATQYLLRIAKAANQIDSRLIDLSEKPCSTDRPQRVNDAEIEVASSFASAHGVIIASPVYPGSIPAALESVLYSLPVSSLAGKPVGILAVGGTFIDFQIVDSHLRNVLPWFGGLVVPFSTYLTDTDTDWIGFQLTQAAQRKIKVLAEAVRTLAETQNFLVGADAAKNAKMITFSLRVGPEY